MEINFMYKLLTSMPLLQGINGMDLARIESKVKMDFVHYTSHNAPFIKQGNKSTDLLFLSNGEITRTYSHQEVPFKFTETIKAPFVIEQLVIWAERVGVPIVKQNMGSDPASVAFDTLSSAVANDCDVVLIDTAGRLHNKKGLMDELSKIKRVMQKVVPNAPHDVLLVLDGSTGQNAFEQAKQFTAATDVTSMAITKLDGSAKGGVVVGISDQFKIPVRYIGLGEGMEDLQPFNRKEFVDSLFG